MKTTPRTTHALQAQRVACVTCDVTAVMGEESHRRVVLHSHVLSVRGVHGRRVAVAPDDNKRRQDVQRGLKLAGAEQKRGSRGSRVRHENK